MCVFRSRLAYFAVFDGHGGARASQFAAEYLHHTLLNKFPKGIKTHTHKNKQTHSNTAELNYLTHSLVGGIDTHLLLSCLHTLPFFFFFKWVNIYISGPKTQQHVKPHMFCRLLNQTNLNSQSESTRCPVMFTGEISHSFSPLHPNNWPLILTGHVN